MVAPWGHSPRGAQMVACCACGPCSAFEIHLQYTLKPALNPHPHHPYYTPYPTLGPRRKLLVEFSWIFCICCYTQPHTRSSGRRSVNNRGRGVDLRCPAAQVAVIP